MAAAYSKWQRAFTASGTGDAAPVTSSFSRKPAPLPAASYDCSELFVEGRRFAPGRLILMAKPSHERAARFAHVLLFDCPVCRHPLASACLANDRSLEVADRHWFTPHCHCGWSGDVVGVTARRHWV